MDGQVTLSSPGRLSPAVGGGGGPALEVLHVKSCRSQPAIAAPSLRVDPRHRGLGCPLQAPGWGQGGVVVLAGHGLRGPACLRTAARGSWTASTKARLQPLHQARSPHCQRPTRAPHPTSAGFWERGNSRLPQPSWGGRVYKNRSLHDLQETLPFLRTTFSSLKGCLEVSGGLSLLRRPSQRTPPCLLEGLAPEAEGTARGRLPTPARGLEPPPRRSVRAHGVPPHSPCLEGLRGGVRALCRRTSRVEKPADSRLPWKSQPPEHPDSGRVPGDVGTGALPLPGRE